MNLGDQGFGDDKGFHYLRKYLFYNNFWNPIFGQNLYSIEYYK